MHLYVYDMGIIDFYSGMMPLHDYIQLCVKNDLVFGGTHHYLSVKELKQFLIKSFIAVKSHDTYWEGDIRGLNEIAISAIPRPGEDPIRVLVFKQDNNGHSFMVGETTMKLCYPDDADVKQIMKMRNFNSTELLKWFDQSYELTEDLFGQSFDESFLSPKKKLVVSIPIQKNDEPDEILKDFEKIS